MRAAIRSRTKVVGDEQRVPYLAGVAVTLSPAPFPTALSLPVRELCREVIALRAEVDALKRELRQEDGDRR